MVAVRGEVEDGPILISRRKSRWVQRSHVHLLLALPLRHRPPTSPSIKNVIKLFLLSSSLSLSLSLSSLLSLLLSSPSFSLSPR